MIAFAVFTAVAVAWSQMGVIVLRERGKVLLTPLELAMIRASLVMIRIEVAIGEDVLPTLRRASLSMAEFGSALRRVRL